MKKCLAVLCLFALMLSVTAFCENSASTTDDWYVAPAIIKAYEISEGKIYLEWTGNAPVYQVYMDGDSVADVIVPNATIKVKEGTHTINIFPINEQKVADTNIDIGLGANAVNTIGGDVNLDLDLAVLGIDPKKLTAGYPSADLYIDYTPSTIYDASPDDLIATTDFNDVVSLSFTDRHYSDEYTVTIKVGKDENHVTFVCDSDESGKYIIKNKATVTLILDPDYLISQECMVPELGEKYTFTVQLRKYADDMLTGENIEAIVHTSEVSDKYKYTPVAAWKTAPVVTYASQTADGQITIEWTHDDGGKGCEYIIKKAEKTLGVTTGSKKVATVTEHSFVINDLMNDDYAFFIIPKYDGEEGEASEDINIEVKNSWVVAPSITCEQTGSNTIDVKWTAAEGVESYHIVVYTGDNDSLLRFVDLDYREYAKYDVPVESTDMVFTFTYTENVDPENGEKVKFEIYGIRHTEDGKEQKTSTTKKATKLEAID